MTDNYTHTAPLPGTVDYQVRVRPIDYGSDSDDEIIGYRYRWKLADGARFHSLFRTGGISTCSSAGRHVSWNNF